MSKETTEVSAEGRGVTIKELRNFLNTIPVEFDDFEMVNGEVAYLAKMGLFIIRLELTTQVRALPVGFTSAKMGLLNVVLSPQAAGVITEKTGLLKVIFGASMYIDFPAIPTNVLLLINFGSDVPPPPPDI